MSELLWLELAQLPLRRYRQGGEQLLILRLCDAGVTDVRSLKPQVQFLMLIWHQKRPVPVLPNCAP